jgi:hypothetical protein
VFAAEPAGPVARFETLEFISAGDGVEEDEVGNGRVLLANGFGERAAECGPGKAGALGIAALEQADGSGCAVFMLRTMFSLSAMPAQSGMSEEK